MHWCILDLVYKYKGGGGGPSESFSGKLPRINANHMDNTKGSSVRSVEDLSIKDMIASDKEKDYIFINLVSYFAHRLVTRHPHIYKSISTCINPNRPHQFQAAMDQKSEEITGKENKHKIG